MSTEHKTETDLLERRAQRMIDEYRARGGDVSAVWLAGHIDSLWQTIREKHNGPEDGWS